MSACCSHCISVYELMSCRVTVMCLWKPLFGWLSTSVLVCHTSTCLDILEKGVMSPITEYGVQYWVIGIDESICVWLLDNRGYILHFFFSSLYIFYLHWFVALALHMCNKYSVLYFCAFCCILCTNVASFTVFWQFLFNYVPLNVKSSIWVYIFEFLVCGNINP